MFQAFGENVVVVVLQSVGVWSDHFNLSVVQILARYAPFLGRCFFAFFFPWPTSLPQQALEELAVLVEVFDEVVVVGAWALHEIVEVAQRVLLGLRARVIGHGDRREVGRLAAILSVLFFPSAWRGPRLDPSAWPYLCRGLR